MRNRSQKNAETLLLEPTKNKAKPKKKVRGERMRKSSAQTPTTSRLQRMRKNSAQTPTTSRLLGALPLCEGSADSTASFVRMSNLLRYMTFENWFLSPKQHGLTRQRVYARRMHVIGHYYTYISCLPTFLFPTPFQKNNNLQIPL